MKKQDAIILPVYDVDRFRGQGSKTSFFDIRVLEQHVREYEITFHPHRHNCYLVLIVTQGTGKHLIDFVTHEIKPFTAFFLTPGQIHTWSLSEDAKGFVLFFTSSFYLLDKREKHLSDFPFFRMLGNPGTIQLNEKKETLILALLQGMLEENGQGQFGRDEILRNSLEILLTRISRYCPPSTAVEATATVTLQLRQLESLIERHFIKYKSVSDYADQLNVTAKHLNEVCKLALNKTVSDLIHERQLLEARRLLAFTSLSIKQIADHLDFGDKSYFIRFFKKQTGVTPDLFRENYLKVHQHP